MPFKNPLVSPAVMQPTHPTTATLSQFVLGQLPDEERTQVESHVLVCAPCAAVCESIPDDLLVRQARDAAPLVNDEALPAEQLAAQFVDHPRYRLLGFVGSGGMGTVYRAEHLMMQREVALKVIRHDVLTSPDAIYRFRREVKTAAKLNHPNIVTAYDADQLDETHFLVTEYVAGLTLAEWVAEQGPLAPEVACRCIRDAACGLQHAHEQGMIHRDVKPQNIIATASQQSTKVLDFGLAKLAETKESTFRESETSFDKLPLQLTHLDQVLGTRSYMAPEQLADAQTASVQSDVYGLGGTLYFLLTGETLPADRSSVRLGANIPWAVRRMVERMIAVSPVDRYESMEQVIVAVDKIYPRFEQPSRRGAVAMLGAVLLLIAAAWSMRAIVFSSKDEPGPSSNASHLFSPPRILFVLPLVDLWYDDYGPVREYLENAGAEITTAAAGTVVTVQAESGGVVESITPDMLLADIEASSYDALVLPGGWHDELKDEQEPATHQVRQVIQELLDDDKYIAAIGSGQQVLAASGYLDDLPVARPPAPALLPNSGAIYLDKRVVKAGQIITGADPDWCFDFAAEIERVLWQQPLTKAEAQR